MRALTIARYAVAVCIAGFLCAPFAVTWITGTQTLEVDGGSMAPTYRRGDLVVIDTNPDPEVYPGDVVTVRRPTGVLYTHRILDIAPDDAITTQGDANPTPDTPTITRNEIVGIVVAHIPQPWAGMISASQSLPGRISLGIILAGLIFLPAPRTARDSAAAVEEQKLPS